MSWNDYYERRSITQAILRHARRNPEAELAFEEIDGATEEFADRDELLRFLHYKWMQQLTGRVAVALETAQTGDLDKTQAVAQAWRALAKDNETLRRVLDQNRTDGTADAFEREQRMLAMSAGLVEPTDSIEECNRIGAAFVEMIRTPNLPVPTENVGLPQNA